MRYTRIHKSYLQADPDNGFCRARGGRCYKISDVRQSLQDSVKCLTSTFCFRVVAFLVVIFLISACLMRLYSRALILELLYRSHKQTNMHMFSCRFRYHYGSIAKYNFGPLRHPLLFAHTVFLGSSMFDGSIWLATPESLWNTPNGVGKM